MLFIFDCPNCGDSYEITKLNLGRIDHCLKCGNKFDLSSITKLPDMSVAPSALAQSNLPLEEKLPSAFGRYKILKKLGQGGMGVVYLANDIKLNRQVALKAPLKDFARFLREARVAAQFHHPNFCPIHDIGEENGAPFIVMAFIEGKSLDKLIDRKQPWEARRAVELVRELALALAEAHRKGIIHRDLKPPNIMVDSKGQLFLMDFGLARQIDSADARVTLEGQFLGSAAYIPPEQVHGRVEEVGPRSDLYSLGVVLYELLTGRPPFIGALTSVLLQVINNDPAAPSTSNKAINPYLEAIVLKAMAKKQEDRFASMDDFAGVLQKWLDVSYSSEVEKKNAALAQSLTTPIPPASSPGGIKRKQTIATGTHVSSLVEQFEGIITKSIDMKLVLIPAGEFLMGAADDEPEARDDEKPRHRVRITRSFYLGVYQVTQAEYQAVMRTNPSHFSANGKGKDNAAGFDTSRFPVENVSYQDAVAFCNRLSEREGLSPCYGPSGKMIAEGTGYRLPTEAEWEYACRAGTQTVFAFGDRLELTGANFDGNLTYNGSAKGRYLERPVPVGSYPCNEFGLFDMHGNVWELCSDSYNIEYYKRSVLDDPQGPSQAALRVYRGGSWGDFPQGCRSARRNRCKPDFRSLRIGFRVARSRKGDR
jgi:eukaryotic-like serine/threonine-protein kinase